jgi:hypothetical protein
MGGGGGGGGGGELLEIILQKVFQILFAEPIPAKQGKRCEVPCGGSSRDRRQGRGEEDGQHLHPPPESWRSMPQSDPHSSRNLVQVQSVLQRDWPRQRNYVRLTEEKLTEMRGTVRGYVRMRNIKRASVIEMGQLLTPNAGQSSYLHEEEIWGKDPVHLTSKGYSMTAAGLESLIYEKRGEEKEAAEKGGQGPAKKPRYDAAENRPAWVKGSVAEAVRRGGGGQPRPPFKQPSGWRGGYQPTGVGGASHRRGGGGDRRSVIWPDPEQALPEAEATAGGGVTEPPGGLTGVGGDPGELPAYLESVKC